MKYSLVYTLTLSIIILSSCSNENETEKKSFFEHFKQTELLVHPYISNIIVHIQKATTDTFITYFKKNENQIIIADYGRNTKNDTLKLDGFFVSYNIEHILDYCFVNPDTIFILANYFVRNNQRLDYAIFHFNIHGRIIQKWDIAKITGIDHDYFNVSSSYSGTNRMLYNNDKSILICKTDIIYSPYKKFDVEKVPSELVLNISTNEGYLIYAKPKIYGKGDFYGNHAKNHSKALINDTTLVLSFPIDHNLYKFSISGKLLLKKECKSIYIDEMKSFEKEEAVTFSKLSEAQTCYPYYYQIVFDTRKKYIYRIVHHEQNLINKSGEKNTEYDRSFSLMVIDENLNVLGEYFIPPYHFVPYLPKINNQQNLYLELFGNKNYIVIAEYDYIEN